MRQRWRARGGDESGGGDRGNGRGGGRGGGGGGGGGSFLPVGVAVISNREESRYTSVGSTAITVNYDV